MSTVISVDRIAKYYNLGLIGGGTLRADLERWWARRRGRPDPLLKIGAEDHGNRSGEYIWALRDITFDVRNGEILGVIGQNGAGKSTLLKILSRITEPTSGTIGMKGRVASMLEVGTGFHSELTGRENVYLNGAILGMTKAEVDRKFDEIVDFSGVEQYIDTPVKRYSSGMQVRLAFAVAAHLEPEILLVDEVLAVGDVAFQRKCLNKMQSVGAEGRTILFVSHNMAAVRHLCTRGIVLDKGRNTYDGAIDDAVGYYLDLMEPQQHLTLADRKDRIGNGKLRLLAFRFLNQTGNPVSTLVSGETCSIGLSYVSGDGRPLRHVTISLCIDTLQGERICLLQSNHSADGPTTLPAEGELICEIPRLFLNTGLYSITAYIEVQNEVADWIRDAARVQVVMGDFFGTGKTPDSHDGHVLVDHKWRVRSPEIVPTDA